jgi:hypothetical protein
MRILREKIQRYGFGSKLSKKSGEGRELAPLLSLDIRQRLRCGLPHARDFILQCC